MFVNGEKWPSVNFHRSSGPGSDFFSHSLILHDWTVNRIFFAIVEDTNKYASPPLPKVWTSKFHELKMSLQMSIHRNRGDVYVSPWFFLLFDFYFVKLYLVAMSTMIQCFLCSPASVFISTCCHSLGVYFVTQSFPKNSGFDINIRPDTHETPCLRSFPVAGREEGCSWSVTQTVNIWLQRNVRIKDSDNETHCFSDTQAALVHCCVLSTEAFSLYLSWLVSWSFTQTETPHRLIDGLKPRPLPCYRLSLLCR